MEKVFALPIFLASLKELQRVKAWGIGFSGSAPRAGRVGHHEEGGDAHPGRNDARDVLRLVERSEVRWLCEHELLAHHRGSVTRPAGAAVTGDRGVCNAVQFCKVLEVKDFRVGAIKDHG